MITLALSFMAFTCASEIIAGAVAGAEIGAPGVVPETGAVAGPEIGAARSAVPGTGVEATGGGGRAGSEAESSGAGARARAGAESSGAGVRVGAVGDPSDNAAI